MKLKALSLALLSTLCASQALAEQEIRKIYIEEESYSEDDENSGIYVGAAVGFQSFSSDTTLNLGPIDVGSVVPTLPVGIDAKADQDLGDTGWAGNIFAGYGMDFGDDDQFYLGLEVDATYNTAEAESDLVVGVPPILDHISVLNTTVQVKESYGLTLLPGYRPIEDALLYLRGGVVWGIIETDVTGVITNSNERHNKAGGKFGGGVQYDLTDNLSLRGEYVYTVYSTVTADLNQTINLGVITPGLVIPVPAKETFAINTSTLNVGVVYTF